MTTTPQARMGHRLLQLGVALFLLGLLIGFAVPAVASPRLGLASHMEAVMNGLFLIALGLAWDRVVLSLAPAMVLACVFVLAGLRRPTAVSASGGR